MPIVNYHKKLPKTIDCRIIDLYFSVYNYKKNNKFGI